MPTQCLEESDHQGRDRGLEIGSSYTSTGCGGDGVERVAVPRSVCVGARHGDEDGLSRQFTVETLFQAVLPTIDAGQPLTVHAGRQSEVEKCTGVSRQGLDSPPIRCREKNERRGEVTEQIAANRGAQHPGSLRIAILDRHLKLVEEPGVRARCRGVGSPGVVVRSPAADPLDAST